MSFEITPLVPVGRQIIQAYGDGGFRISGVDFTGPVLVFLNRTVRWEPVEMGSPESFVEVHENDPRPEILVVGCGAAFQPPPPGLAGQLRGLGLALEWMATGAACRTYNVLALEERQAAAALLAVD